MHGLEQIVHGLGLKGLHGVLVVGGDEHQRRKRLVGGPGVGQRHGGVQPRLAGHADVEEQHIGLQRQRLLHGREAIAHRGGNLQLRPRGAQLLLQRGGQQGLVFGNEGARGCGCHGC